MPSLKGRLTLPANPSLEHLKREAKERLTIIRTHAPEAQLSDAQFALARDYGFSSWRDLVGDIKQASGTLEACTGFYRHDPALIRNTCFEVRCADGRLFIEKTGGARFGLMAQENGTYSSPGLTVTYRFEKDGAGQVGAMVVEDDGHSMRAERIDPAVARTIRADHAAALKDQARTRSPVTLPPEILDRYVGHYASAFGESVEILRKDDKLLAQMRGQPRLPFLAESEDKIFLAVAPMQMHFTVQGGRATGLILHRGGVETAMKRLPPDEASKASAATAERLEERLRPRQAVAIDPLLLPRYAGRYRLDGNREMVVSTEGGHLFAQITGQDRYEIYPEASGKFFWTITAAQISFFTDHSGRVSHAVLHQVGRQIPLARTVGTELP
jgi:hypothetical protein